MAVELFVTNIMKNVYDKNDDPRAPDEIATYKQRRCKGAKLKKYPKEKR
jgi:hypothetical protein